jgi:hypothetical protein
LRWRGIPAPLQFLLAVTKEVGQLPSFKFQLGLAYFYLTRYPMAVQEFEDLARANIV